MSSVDERYQAKIAGRRNGTVPVFQQAPVVSETATDPASVDARFRAKMAARAVAVTEQPDKKPEQKGDAGSGSPPDKAEKVESKDSKPEDDKPKKPEQKGDAGSGSPPDKAEKVESKDSKPEDDKPKKPEQKGDAGGRR